MEKVINLLYNEIFSGLGFETTELEVSEYRFYKGNTNCISKITLTYDKKGKEIYLDGFQCNVEIKAISRFLLPAIKKFQYYPDRYGFTFLHILNSSEYKSPELEKLYTIPVLEFSQDDFDQLKNIIKVEFISRIDKYQNLKDLVPIVEQTPQMELGKYFGSWGPMVKLIVLYLTKNPNYDEYKKWSIEICTKHQYIDSLNIINELIENLESEKV